MTYSALTEFMSKKERADLDRLLARDPRRPGRGQSTGHAELMQMMAKIGGGG